MPLPALAPIIAFIGRQGVQAAIKKYGKAVVDKAAKQMDRQSEGKAYQEFKKTGKELDRATKEFGKNNPGKTKGDKNLQDKYDKMFDARGKYYEKQIKSEINQITGKPSAARAKLDSSKTLQRKRAEAQRTEKKNVQKKKPENIKRKKDLIKAGLKAVGAGAVPVAGGLAYEKWGKSRDDEPVKKMSAKERRERAEGYKKGGIKGKSKSKKPKVRGAGIERKGLRPAKMR